MGELTQIEKYRKKKQLEEIDDLPDDIRDSELGAEVIRLVTRIDDELGDEPA